jgi:hypothetical protein
MLGIEFADFRPPVKTNMSENGNQKAEKWTLLD